MNPGRPGGGHGVAEIIISEKEIAILEVIIVKLDHLDLFVV